MTINKILMKTKKEKKHQRFGITEINSYFVDWSNILFFFFLNLIFEARVNEIKDAAAKIYKNVVW